MQLSDHSCYLRDKAHPFLPNILPPYLTLVFTETIITDLQVRLMLMVPHSLFSNHEQRPLTIIYPLLSYYPCMNTTNALALLEVLVALIVVAKLACDLLHPLLALSLLLWHPICTSAKMTIAESSE